MPNRIEIRTSNWVLRLPADWSPVEDQKQGFHFESADGNKGLYIATHIIGADHPSSVEELAEWFIAADIATLDQMDGFSWATRARSAESDAGVCTALLDRYAQAQDYRFIGKILARPGQVVRASFQDYRCASYANSNAYFAPIIASLEFVAVTPEGAGIRFH